MERTTTVAALAVLCACVFAQAFFSMRQKSLTYDELSYVPAGYSYVVTGDFRLRGEGGDLDGISGATYSTRGRAEAVRRSVALYPQVKALLRDGDEMKGGDP